MELQSKNSLSVVASHQTVVKEARVACCTVKEVLLPPWTDWRSAGGGALGVRYDDIRGVSYKKKSGDRLVLVLKKEKEFTWYDLKKS